MENYREFASFYEMKEWLKQGEYVLPAIYRTKNDGKYYFDYAVEIEEPDVVSNSINGDFKGVTLNSQEEMSKVLCSIMDSHFMNSREGYEDSKGNIHLVNKGAFDGLQPFNLGWFRHFEHYGSVVKKAPDVIENQNFHNMILPHQFSNSNIVEIVIPEGIEFIGGKAFLDCKNLRKVKLPSTLKRIGRSAFRGCESLEEIYIPGNCKVIERGAFMCCTNLKTVTFENGIEDIGEGAFKDCGITALFLPKSVHTVRAKAFARCSDLKKVYIGKNLNNKGISKKYFLNGTAFYQSKIEKFHVDAQNQYVKTGINGELMIKYRKKGNWMIIKIPFDTTITYYESDPEATSMVRNLLDKYNIPTTIDTIIFNGVRCIPKYCCSNNNNIKNVALGINVKSISHNAFGNCYGVTSVAIFCNDDLMLKNTTISLLSNGKEGKNKLLRFNKDCKVVLSSDSMLPAYKRDAFWGQYFPKSYVIVDMFQEWQFASNLINSNPFYQYIESHSNYDVENDEAEMRVLLINVPYFNFEFWSDSETNYDYVMVSQLDTSISNDTLYSNTSLVKYHSKGIGTNVVNAEYDNIPSGEHEITILYRKDESGSEGEDRGYVRFLKNKGNVLDFEIFLENFERCVGDDGTHYFKSVIENVELGYALMRIYFKNNPDFTIYVTSDSEQGYDFLAVSPLDTSYLNDVNYFLKNDDTESLKEYTDWFYTTLDDYYDLYGNPADKANYYELMIPNDGGYHFIEVYYIKDGSQNDKTDSGYVIIPGTE